MDSPLTTRAVILRALSRQRGYGLELIERVEKDVGITLFQGSVYPQLVSLEEEGLIRRSRAVTSNTRVCVYEITAKGRRTCAEYRRILSLLYGFMESEGTERGLPSSESTVGVG